MHQPYKCLLRCEEEELRARKGLAQYKYSYCWTQGGGGYRGKKEKSQFCFCS